MNEKMEDGIRRLIKNPIVNLISFDKPIAPAAAIPIKNIMMSKLLIIEWDCESPKL